MPFIRLNQNYIYDTRKYDTSSNIYMSYRKEVDILTAPSLPDMHIPNYMDCYVEFPQHKQLKTLLENNGLDGLVYLTGVTGSGKTTLLNAVFDHKNNDIVFKDKTAIITFVWKPTDNEKKNPHISVNANYSKFLLACIEKICEQHLLQFDDFNTSEFLSFIKSNDFAYYSQGDGKEKQKIDNLKNFDPIKFSIFALRFTLSKTPINNIIFLFDELEEAGKGENGEILEIKLVELAYTIKHLLSARTSEEKEKDHFRFSVLISCRHYVYRMITNKKKQKQNQFWNKVNAEAQSETMIDIPKSPDFVELIRKRKKVIRETIQSENDKKEFDEIFLIAYDIITKCGEIILALSIGNIRDAFKYVRYLLFNKRWLQKKENYMGAFSINSSRQDYNLMLTSYLRALALRENIVFTHDSIIPNLLDNTNGKKDLSVLMVLSFFINKQNDPELRQDFSSQYDVNTEFNSVIEKLFHKDTKTYYNAFNYLLEERILLRSAYCCQQDSADEPNINNNIDEWKYVYISQQANILWDLLGQNSVLFEMFVDDIKLNECIQSIKDLSKRSYLQFNVLAFKECINYLKHLIDIEISILKDLYSTSYLTEYRENFGTNPITLHLYNGLKKSFDSYYKEKKEEKICVELKALLNDLSEKIENSEIFKLIRQ